MNSAHQHVIPNTSNLIIRLSPFQGIKVGSIWKAKFTNDNSLLFVLSESGELVTYDTSNWKEKWRQSTGAFFGSIQCDNQRSIVWTTHNMVLNFEGEQEDEKVTPDFEYDPKGAKVFRSLNGSHFLINNYNEKLVLHDSAGHQILEYSNPNNDSLYASFFPDGKRILVREESSGIFKIYGSEAGNELKAFKIEGTITSMEINSNGEYLSVDDLSSRSTNIIELASTKTVYEFSELEDQSDYLGTCIWSNDNKFVLIPTTNGDKLANTGFCGHLSVYPIGL